MMDSSSTKLFAILSMVTAVALAGIAMILIQQNEEAQASKAFGQCNKNQNESNHKNNITGKAGSDSRKAACKSLKPGKG
jgi:preprotein translocase subunit SecG